MIHKTISTALLVSFSALIVAPNIAYARCGEGMYHAGGNACLPIDSNDLAVRKSYCKGKTMHYGQIQLRNGTVKSLNDYYAKCMGSPF